MKILICLVSLLALSISAPLWAKMEYLDKNTPPGSIPPPPNLRQHPVIKGQERSFGKIGGQEDTATAGSSEATMKDFRNIYMEKGKPRIAIFLNRVLSDEVREWKTSVRHIESGDKKVYYNTEKEGKGGQIEKTSYEGPQASYTQQHIENDGSRPNPGEEFFWAFENGFMGPFLKSGAKLVDRATIMRLAAAADKDQGSVRDLIVVKKVEMDALINNADIFVEILVTRAPNAPGGYLMKSIAKEVRTGRIIGTANNKAEHDNAAGLAKKAIATETGYELIDSPDAVDVEKSSQTLAINLMDSFVNMWRLDK